MHIGFLTPEYPHKLTNASGGLGTSIKSLANSLIREGVEVTIFIYGQNQYHQFLENGIHFHLIKEINYIIGGFYCYRKYLQNYIAKVVEHCKIDLIEAPDWTGISAFMNFKVPLVIRCNGSDAYFCNLEGRKQRRKNRWFEKEALNNSDSIISASTFTGQKTKEIFNLKKNIQTIYNGVNTNDFKPILVDQVSHSILYFGTIIRKKGVFELASSFNHLKSRVPNALLKLLGKDSIDIIENRSTLEIFMELIDKQYRGDVIHLAEVPYREVGIEIAKAEVVVLPSYAEAFPMTWLEAMAMKKAMVTSNIGWANEMMIDGETGFMVNPSDHVDFADKIQLLLNNSNLRQRMGEKAREQVKQFFSSEVLLKRNIEFYKEMVH